MKKINQFAKRALSLLIILAVFMGSLFTTSGITINAKAQTEEPATSGKTVYLNEGTLIHTKYISKITLDEFKRDKQGNYIIDTAEKLAYICTVITAEDSYGKTFKVADDIDAFVLQTKSYASGIKDLSDASAVKAYFESNKIDCYNWMTTYTGTGIFNGTFDGNGVAIYGLYAKASSKRPEIGLFPMVDGGGQIGTSDTPTVDTTVGTTLKNFALRNSYVWGFYNLGAVVGATMYNQAGAFCDGFVKIDGCEVSNCYLYVDDSIASDTKRKTGIATSGALSGSTSSDPVKANHCLVYNNKFDANIYDSSNDTYTFTENVYMRLFGYNRWKDVSGGTIEGELNNSIVIDVGLSGTEVRKFTNAYANVVENWFNVIYFDDINYFKGSAGKTYMTALDWATSDTAGNGTMQWYARENDLPTPIMPADWKDTVKACSVWSGPDINLKNINYADGTGTKDDPFIIKTADQLWKMVKEGGCSNKRDQVKGQEGEEFANYDPFYYKVADGVDALYLNSIMENPTYEALMALINPGNGQQPTAKNWLTDTWFYGNFDGNGVTIYGLYSEASGSKVGFVYGIDGSNAAIKNVNFKIGRIRSSSGDRAAVVTTNVRKYVYPYTDSSGNEVIFNHEANINISNVSINDCGILAYDHPNATPKTFDTLASAGGIMSINEIPDSITFSNCLFDGSTSFLSAARLSDDAATHSIAGIASFPTSSDNITIQNCVSIDMPLVPMVTTTAKSGSYERYVKPSQIVIKNCYSPINEAIAAPALNYKVITDGISDITGKTSFTKADLPHIDWTNQWHLVDDKPMPKTASAASDLGIYPDYTSFLTNYNSSGLTSTEPPYQYGNFGWYNELAGSGTVDDPYIIDTAQKLAIAIATGGKNLDDKLYYKLSCDIDLGGLPWLETDKTVKSGRKTLYRYTPFEGILDGDGHTVSGLFSIDVYHAGLIPVLNGGIVKNLHVRNSYATSNNTAGIIVGQISSDTGAAIRGCSVESSSAVAKSTSTIIGKGSFDHITNSYMILENSTRALYFLNEGTNFKEFKTGIVSAEDAQAILADSNSWYLGGGEGAFPRLKNFAQAHSIADIDGDGIVSDYTTNDLVALRRHLVWDTDYANVYGDVNSNGSTSISDLAILKREMIGDYADIKDGFWRNVELGKVKIYYAENDTQDMARKVELYLESVYPGVDIIKVAGTKVTDKTVTYKEDYVKGQQNTIVITKASEITDETDGTYAIKYDKANNLLEIYGCSFTAVEAAVNEFIAKADPQNNIVVPGNRITGKVSAEKTRKYIETGEGKSTYVYYAWGDEFDSQVAGNCEHKYNEGKIEREAQLFEAGVKRYTCTLCGDSYTESFALDSIKILSIGNNYSLDSFNQLYALLKSAGVKNVDIAIMYYGGRSLNQHYYSIIDPTGYADKLCTLVRNNNGTWTETPNYTIDQILAEGGWDVISLQNSPTGAGDRQSATNIGSEFNTLKLMTDHIGEKCPNSKIVWFMTWPFEEGNTYLSVFNNSRQFMYEEIVRCVQEKVLAKDTAIHSVSPVGTAIMNAYTSNAKNYVYRDGSNLNKGLGYCVGALTWLCYLTGLSVEDVDLTVEDFDFDSPGIASSPGLASEEDIAVVSQSIGIIKESAKNALKSPYRVTQSTNPSNSAFNKGQNISTIKKGTWTLSTNRSEEHDGVPDTDPSVVGSKYHDIEAPSIDALKDLWEVNDGKLKIWRGINNDVYAAKYVTPWNNSGWGSVNGEATGYMGVSSGKVGTTNDFGSAIDENDIYVDPGLATTANSMLFKQGYTEMRASLPSDGHAFSAWWLLNGIRAYENTQVAQTLYSKVYPLNEKYDHFTNTVDATNISTYKYKMPMAYLEFDLVEFSQERLNNINTGNSVEYFLLGLHKYYTGANSDNSALYIYDWDANKFHDSCYKDGKLLGISYADFGNTSNTSTFVHYYQRAAQGSTDITSPGMFGKYITDQSVHYTNSFSINTAKAAGRLTSEKTIQDYYTYGFYWDVDEKAKTYRIIGYVDFNEDGKMTWDEMILYADHRAGNTKPDPFYPTSGPTEDEFDTWNQYAYMLLNNTYYTMSYKWGTLNGQSSNISKIYTDLLTQDGGYTFADKTGIPYSVGAKDKTTFEVEYVRVYQENGKRDIVTPETEAFNTNDRFGYGDND